MKTIVKAKASTPLLVLSIPLFIMGSALFSWGFTISPSGSTAPKTISREYVIPGKHTKRLNILVSKIEKGYIYDDASNKYKIHHFTRIVDNRKKGDHSVTIGELVFQNGMLSYVILKGEK